MNLNKLGFDKWFSDKTDSSKSADYEIARITAVNKDSFQIRNREKFTFQVNLWIGMALWLSKRPRRFRKG